MCLIIPMKMLMGKDDVAISIFYIINFNYLCIFIYSFSNIFRVNDEIDLEFPRYASSNDDSTHQESDDDDDDDDYNDNDEEYGDGEDEEESFATTLTSPSEIEERIR